MSTTRAWPVRRSLDELLAGALGLDHTEAAPDLQPAGVEVHVPPAQGERLAAAGCRRLAQVSDCRRSSIPEWEDQAGAGRGGDQPAVPITNFTVGEGGSTSWFGDPAGRGQLASTMPDRAQVADLDLQTRVATPAGSVLCTAQPATESRSVQTRPPCTTPMGLYADSSG
jgi:hypothetical protein